MQYVYTCVIGIILLSLCYLAGQLAGFIKMNINPLIFGFVLLNALFYITAFPFMFFNGKLDHLTAVYLLIVLSVTVLAFFLLRKKGIRLPGRKTAYKNSWPLVISVIIITLQIVLSLILAHYDADDSFYIPRTSAMLHTGGINVIEPSTGLPGMGIQQQYSMVGYEVMMAVLCRVFHVNAAWMYHTAIVPVLLILHYIVIYEFGKAVFSGNAHRFLLLIAIINIFSGYSVYSRGAFAILRMWQGKAAMVNIIMPVIVLVFVMIIKEGKVMAGQCVFLAMTLVGGYNFSVVAIYLLPIQYAVLSLTYAAADVRRFFKNIKSNSMLLLPILFLLPYVCIIYVYKLRGGAIDVATAGIESFSYMDVLRKINGCRAALLVVVIAVIFFCIFEKGYKRLLFGVYPLICAVTALNPFLAGYIAKYITGVPVFWRLFWIVGMSYIVAAMILSLYCRKEMFGIASAGLILALSAHIIYTPDNFSLAGNIEKIESVTYEVANAIADKDSGLMLPEDIGYGIRQYRGDIRLVWSRYSRELYEASGNFENIAGAYEQLYTGRICSQEIKEILLRYGADYVLLYKDTDGVGIMGDIVWDNDKYYLCALRP